MNEIDLTRIASETKENSYSPYSRFKVGAALLAESGKVYTGVNIENASYGSICCAERTAVFKAVSEGERKLKAIAISSDSEEFIYPCGICRQVLSEFGDNDMKIICCKKNGGYRVFVLEEILPYAYKYNVEE